MSVVPLTLTISLGLVFTFILLFLREHKRGARSCAERDSLLPLGEETPRIAVSESTSGPEVTAPAHAHDHEAEHDHEGEDCGCRSGRRAPCVGCLKRATDPV